MLSRHLHMGYRETMDKDVEELLHELIRKTTEMEQTLQEVLRRADRSVLENDAEE